MAVHCVMLVRCRPYPVQAAEQGVQAATKPNPAYPDVCKGIFINQLIVGKIWLDELKRSENYRVTAASRQQPAAEIASNAR